MENRTGLLVYNMINIQLVNILLISCICVISLGGYMLWPIEAFIGFAFLVLSLLHTGVKARGGMNYLLVLLLVLFSCLHLIHYSRSFLCVSMCLYVLFFFNLKGKVIQFYHISTLVVILPLYQFMEHSISVPLRIQLSELAVNLLGYFDKKSFGSGNLIFFNGKSYLIDIGCAGLKMLRITLLFCGMYIFMFQDVTKKCINTWWQIGLYFLFVVLNLVSNLIRILLLVLLDVSDTNIMHYVIGGVCLVLYVLLPSFLILKQIFRGLQLRVGKGEEMAGLDSGKSFIWRAIPYFYAGMLCVFLFQKSPKITIENSTCHLSGFEKEILNDGILKFSSDSSLIYYKSIPSVLSLEHNPTVCWSLEGFVLKQICKNRYGEDWVYTGEFEKGAEKIYSAWWFASGSHHTINQLEWRCRSMFIGETYNFINVNSFTKEELDRRVKQLLGS